MLKRKKKRKKESEVLEARQKGEALAAQQLATALAIPSDYLLENPFWALLDSGGKMPPTSRDS
jgi:hypothetical protein